MPSQAIVSKIFALRDDNQSQAHIAMVVGLSQAYVSKLLIRNGYVRPDDDVPHGQKRCKRCSDCRDLETGFSVSLTAADGHINICKVCVAARNSRNRSSMRHRAQSVYGLTLEEYEALKEAAGCCAICGDTTELHLDHNAKSGVVREFLCGRCNRGLGMFLHEPERLQQAINYLRRHDELVVSRSISS